MRPQWVGLLVLVGLLLSACAEQATQPSVAPTDAPVDVEIEHRIVEQLVLGEWSTTRGYTTREAHETEDGTTGWHYVEIGTMMEMSIWADGVYAKSYCLSPESTCSDCPPKGEPYLTLIGWWTIIDQGALEEPREGFTRKWELFLNPEQVIPSTAVANWGHSQQFLILHKTGAYRRDRLILTDYGGYTYTWHLINDLPSKSPYGHVVAKRSATP